MSSPVQLAPLSNSRAEQRHSSKIQGIKLGESSAGVDRTAHIKKLFSAIVSHAGVIERSLRCAIEPGDKESDDAIKALTGFSVLLPYDDTAYHLNPDVRNLVNSVLNQFSSFEMLTRINHTIAQIRTYWDELKRLQSMGQEDDAVGLEITIENSLTDLIHKTEYNLVLLDSQINTDYGNVSCFAAKMAQNISYGKQIETLQAELGQVRELVELIEKEAMGEILHRVRQRIVARLNLREGLWCKRLNDINATISARLNKYRQLDKNMINLGQVDLWLRRNPTLSGMSIEPDLSVDAGLLRPQGMRIRAQIDFDEVRSSTGRLATTVQSMLSRLPPPKEPFKSAPKPAESRYLKRKTMALVQEPIEPVDQMALELIRAMRAPGAVPTSIRTWQTEQRIQEALSEEAWILYAATQLTVQGVSISHVKRDRMPGEFNNGFEDITALPSAQSAGGGRTDRSGRIV